jgi:hypothetical protein
MNSLINYGYDYEYYFIKLIYLIISIDFKSIFFVIKSLLLLSIIIILYSLIYNDK